MLNVAQIIERTEAEGPGQRYAIWVQGCPFRCPGCCNPEMLSMDIQREHTSAATLIEGALAADVEGVSLLGGEPFAQAEGLAEVAEGVQAGGRTVMIYTGYTLEELKANPDPAVHRLLAATDLLVDGRYEAEQRTIKRRWIGSTNQALHFLTDRYREDDPRFTESNQVEIRMKDGLITLNGWPLYGAKTRL